VAQIIIEASASGVRVLSLILSYLDTKMIAEQLRYLKLDFNTLIQHTESDLIQEILNRFTTTEGAVLLSPSCWEGVNLPGLMKNLLRVSFPCSNLFLGVF